ncbi:hypothetical protein BJ165DRAFT_1531433 [Panaeolus papilionaceus]|nr:hypothetical protein BJ165DRAFT_1531433 [Panaeolus papilionaceus]
MNDPLHPFELSPSLPPQPSHFFPDQLQSPEEIRIKINENDIALSLLQDQIRWLEKITKTAKRRVKEYESYSRLLQDWTLQLGQSTIKDLPVLPVEVLTIIFQFYCRDVVFNGPELRVIDFQTYNITFDKSPWILSQVCSTWRQVVLSLPQLWPVLPAMLAPGPSSNESNDISTMVPLGEIRASFYTPIGYEHTLIPLADFELQLSQIRRLAFVYSEQVPKLGDIPLHTLTFTTTFLIEGPGLHDDFFKRLPELAHLVFHCPSQLDRLQRLSASNVTFINANNLTSIDLHNTDFPLVCRILRSAPLLQKLKVFNMLLDHDSWSFVEDQMPSNQTEKIVHMHLQHLHIHSRCRDIATGWGSERSNWLRLLFNNVVDLPRLSTLSVDDGRFGVIASTMIPNLIGSSECLIQDLTLLQSVDDILPTLQSCHDLRRLVIGKRFSDEDLGLLKQPYEGQWLVPRLETLVLFFPCVSSPDSLLELIHARESVDDVQSLPRIEIMVLDGRFSEPASDDDDEALSDTGVLTCVDDEIHFLSVRVRDLVARVLQAAQCGYEIVNNPISIGYLETLCHDIETFEYDLVKHCKTLERKDMLNPMLKIYRYLSDVEGTDDSFVLAHTYAQRLQKVLCLWTHNPWLGQTLPKGWVRMDGSCAEFAKLGYDASHALLMYSAAKNDLGEVEL